MRGNNSSPTPLALIAGILAIVDIRRNPKKHGMGRAVFGIIMAAIGSMGLAITMLALAAGALNNTR